MRHPTVVLIGLVLLLALAACSGNADPSPAPAPSTPPATSSTPSASSTAPTQSPTPTPPPMPQAAKAHTKAGAKAFVQYFNAVVNFAQETGRTETITSLSVPGCAGCEAGVRAIKRVYRAGGRIVGGESTLSNTAVDLSWVGSNAVARVQVDMTNAAEVEDYPGATRDVSRPRSTSRSLLLLRQIDGAWRVAQIEVPA